MVTLPTSSLVAVVIPCYNQAHFLNDSIESVLAQAYPNVEIVVVDDGSADDTAKVSATYPQVRYIHQNNQGLAVARNTGLHLSTSEFLVFLDADDRLLPDALTSGVICLSAHPECAFVSGLYHFIDTDGSILPTWREKREINGHSFVSGQYERIGADGSILDTWPQPRVASDHYAVLLQRNYIAMHATVMYRRDMLKKVGGFDISLRACEDYELYLRLARQFPITCHDEVVAEYRLHSANMSRKSAMMLAASTAVLRSQWSYVTGKPHYEHAYEKGMKFWEGYYSREALKEIPVHLKTRHWQKAVQAAGVFIRYAGHRGKRTLRETLSLTKYYLLSVRRRLIRVTVGWVNLDQLHQLISLNKNRGNIEAQTISGYYIDRFLKYHADDIKGEVLALGKNSFMPQRSWNAEQVNLEIRPELNEDISRFPANSFDCVIAPQVLHCVYNLRAMLKAFYRILKPGGVLLVTLPGMPCNPSQYWAFTMHSAQRLFAESFLPTHVQAYGNVLTAVTQLLGFSVAALRQNEITHQDDQYQVLITVRATKSGEL
jgi:glycosyltransferase involved in cell wall biosynthesis